MEKKGSDHFRDILNPYGEKSNYGKIGRRRRLSKLNVFLCSIILSVTIYIYILIHLHMYISFIYDLSISNRHKTGDVPYKTWLHGGKPLARELRKSFSPRRMGPSETNGRVRIIFFFGKLT